MIIRKKNEIHFLSYNVLKLSLCAKTADEGKRMHTRKNLTVLFITLRLELFQFITKGYTLVIMTQKERDNPKLYLIL